MAEKLGKKKVWIFAFIVLIGFISLCIFVQWRWKHPRTYTVLEDELILEGKYVLPPYGFKLENHKNGYGMLLTIWTKDRIRTNQIRMQSVYDIPNMKVDEVVEYHWLKSNSVLYLDLNTIVYDDREWNVSAKILYDFHTGEMYVSSNHHLWRIYNQSMGLSTDDWITKEEFNEILEEKSQ